MEISKFLTVVVAVVVVLYSDQATAQGGNTQLMDCTQKLLPCKPYLHNVNPPPPPSCCGPMKEIVEKDAPCICTVFNNPDMLKALNLTKDNALDLPKACGVVPDVSLCTKASSSSPAASPGSTSGGSSVQAVSFIGFGLMFALVAII